MLETGHMVASGVGSLPDGIGSMMGEFLGIAAILAEVKWHGKKKRFLAVGDGQSDFQHPSKPSETNPLFYRVLTHNLNVRSGPGISFAKVGTLRANDIVPVVGYSDDELWVQLDTSGWVSMAYLVPMSPVTVHRR